MASGVKAESFDCFDPPASSGCSDSAALHHWTIQVTHNAQIRPRPLQAIWRDLAVRSVKDSMSIPRNSVRLSKPRGEWAFQRH